MTREELQAKLQMAAAQVKLATGIGNNAAWAACLEAHDHIKKHRSYRHLVKRAYKAALEEFHEHDPCDEEKNESKWNHECHPLTETDVDSDF